VLVRILKRRTSLELDDPQQLLDVEFRRRSDHAPDLRPSVYQVDGAEEALRAFCEHAVSFISPPRGGAGADVQGLGGFTLEVDPGRTLFEFANDHHRELIFHDEAALLGFLMDLVDGFPTRAVKHTKEEILAYVLEHANEPEWQTALATAPQGASWKRKAKVP